MLQYGFFLLLVMQGVIHLFGVVTPITRPWDWAGVAAGLLLFTTAAIRPVAPRWWWTVGAVAIATSQAVIVSRWGDAKLGTLVNVALLVGVVRGLTARGRWSLRAEFERDLSLATPSRARAPLTEKDLAELPPPVRRYVRAAGVVGLPRVQNFRATWVGRIRSGVDGAWMSFTAEQLNTFDSPRRFFFMDARMRGIPVDVLHAFDENGATMRVRLLSLKTMVDVEGPSITRSETVTLFNDLCILAPGELVTSAITWEAIDDKTARAHYTQGANTISATLVFNEADELVDFESSDRNPSPDGSGAGDTPWTTPVSDYARIGPARVARHGETKWHPASGSWTYGEFDLTSLAYDVG